MPFVVTLRRYAATPLPTPDSLLDRGAEAVRMVAGLMPDRWAHRRLADGRALVLVDGVDELSEQRRRAVREWLDALVRTYPDARIVVTSRPVAATERWLEHQGLTPTVLARMTPADVGEFVRRWYLAAAGGDALPCRPDELPGYESALLRHLAGSPGVRALATNPLMCALLCALNLDQATDLPRDRMGLYDAALRLLLERRDAHREIDAFPGLSLDYGRKVELLQGLAWWLSFNGRVEMHGEVALQQLRRRLTMLPPRSTPDIDPETVLRYLTERSGVVREPVVGRVDFVHRTFQEYLAAKEATDEHSVGYLVDRAHLDQWWETVVLAAGHGSRQFREELLTGLLDRADRDRRHARRLRVLAAACLSAATAVSEVVRSRVEEALDAMVPPRGSREVVSLASAGEAVLHRLPARVAGLPEKVAAATVRAAALIHSPATLDLLAQYAQDPRERVQQELADAWDYFDPDEYARRVLADSPLTDGQLTLHSRRPLPSLHHLRHLRELCLYLGEWVPGLDWLHGVERLAELSVSSQNFVDLSPLAPHSGLRYVDVRCAAFHNADTLTRLPDLRSVCLYSPATPTTLDFLRDLVGLEMVGLGFLTEDHDYSALARLNRLSILLVEDSSMPVSALSPLRSLTWLLLYRTRLVGGLDGLVASAPRLMLLRLHSCDDLVDLAPLRKLTELRTLALLDAPPGLDLSPLAGMRLTVELWRQQEVTGLDRLGPGVRIRYL